MNQKGPYLHSSHVPGLIVYDSSVRAILKKKVAEWAGKLMLTNSQIAIW